MRRTQRFRGSAFLLASFLGSLFSQPVQAGWQLRLVDSTGFDDLENTGIFRIRERDGVAYAGTWNPVNGCKVYRSQDGETWESANTGGFGNVNNFSVLSIEWFRGLMYVGIWNSTDGANLFRARVDVPNPADIVWEAVTTNGFGDPGNQCVTSLAEFDGHFYAGCFNPTSGPEVWRSASGNPGEWTQVNVDSWGFASNSDATQMLVHDGYLYVGTESVRAPGVGCQLWRTDGNLAPPYDQWEQVNVGGFGDVTNHNIYGLALFKGHIYAGTWNVTKGYQIWRGTPTGEAPFADWEQVNASGFGDAEDWWSGGLCVLDDTLYAGSIGGFGPVSALFNPAQDVTYAHGGSFFKTRDGADWERIDAPGFLPFPMIGIFWLEPAWGRVLVGGFALDRPAQLWSYEHVLFGDVNGDGRVNAVDVQLVVNGALDIPTPYDCDLNCDGATNAVDIQLVINSIFGIEATACVPMGIYDTGFAGPDRPFVDGYRTTHLAPAVPILNGASLGTLGDRLVASDTDGGTWGDYSLLGVSSTASAFWSGCRSDVTVSGATVEAIRDGIVPAGVAATNYLYDGPLGGEPNRLYCWFGAVRRPAGIDLFDQVGIGGTMAEHTGYYVVWTFGDVTACHAFAPIPGGPLADVTFSIDVDTEGNADFLLNDAPFLESLPLAAQPRTLSIVTQQFGNAAGNAPYSDVVYTRFKCEGAEAPNGPTL